MVRYQYIVTGALGIHTTSTSAIMTKEKYLADYSKPDDFLNVGDTIYSMKKAINYDLPYNEIRYLNYELFVVNPKVRFIKKDRIPFAASRPKPGYDYISYIRNRTRQNKTVEKIDNPAQPSSDRTIHTGPRGGQYYINSNGNKTYVPRSGGHGKH